MAHFISPADLAPFATIESAKAAEMIADAESQAILAASCLPSLLTVPEGETAEQKVLREAHVGAVKAVLRAAILRWEESGTSGGTQTEVRGPFSVTTQYQARRGMFLPVEIQQLQAVCKSASSSKAFAIDTVAEGDAFGHLPWCALAFGATFCSCGVDIAGEPIFEGA